MYKIIRIFNENRRQILIAILTIVFVIIIIRVLNDIAKRENEEKLANALNTTYTQTQSSYNASHPVISGGTISQKSSNQALEVINNFINNCNEGNIQEAYQMLSDDCKEQLYPTINAFRVYYKENFDTKKDYNVQLWTSRPLMYKVNLFDDALSTGKLDNTVSKEDFYTLIKENDTWKINISEYIGKLEIGKNTTKNDIIITVNYKNMYKDYEIYNVTIENSSGKNIMLDSRESTKTMYLNGSTGVKYIAYSNEITKNQYMIKSKYKTTLDIKYSKQYVSKANITSMVFSDVILDSDEYEKDKTNYKNKTSIEINL